MPERVRALIESAGQQRDAAVCTSANGDGEYAVLYAVAGSNVVCIRLCVVPADGVTNSMAFPVDEAQIAAAERQLGRLLPDGLRARLLRNNGGELQTDDDDWILHPVWDATDRKRMSRTANHIVRETEQARAWHGFPDSAISIATNGSGDHLVIHAGSDAVDLWDHETGECYPVTIDWTT